LNIRRILPFAASLLIAVGASGQDAEITVYKTYGDLTAKSGQDFEHYRGYSHTMGAVTLILDDHGDKVKIKCADFWGFRYKDALFRVDKRFDQPAKLISKGRMCYYENGPAHLAMMRDSSDTGDFSIGAYCYVSLDLEDELWQFSGTKKDAKKAREHFAEKGSLYGAYFDCVESTNSVTIHRECIGEFEKNNAE